MKQFTLNLKTTMVKRMIDLYIKRTAVKFAKGKVIIIDTDKTNLMPLLVKADGKLNGAIGEYINQIDNDSQDYFAKKIDGAQGLRESIKAMEHSFITSNLRNAFEFTKTKTKLTQVARSLNR